MAATNNKSLLGPNTLSVEANQIRSIRAGMNVGQHKNIAYMEGKVGTASYFEIGISGETSILGTAAVPETRIFSTFNIGHTRAFDSEVKLLESFAQKFSTNPTISGSLKLVSERPFCESCTGVIEQFNKVFPNVKVEQVSGAFK